LRKTFAVTAAFLFVAFAASAQQYSISTVAGGVPIPTPVAAVNAAVGYPGAIASDAAGNLYFFTDNCLFKIDLSGNLTRIAGTSRPGFSGDGGAATSAQLNQPAGVAIDTTGNLYIADSGNQRIRRITGGVIITIAGTGTAGYSGDNGAATSALLNAPQGLAVDIAGNLYFADSGNNVIRKITTPSSTSGIIYTVAGNGQRGNYSGNGSPLTAEFNAPVGVAVDTLGNVYVADTNNQLVREISASGIVTTIAGTGAAGYSGDGIAAASAQLNYPTYLGLDSVGQLYIDDSKNARVRKILPNGIIATLVGGSGGGVGLGVPAGIALDASSNIYVTDSGNSRVLKVTTTGGVTIIAGSGVRYYLGTGGPAIASQLSQPEGLAVDPGGNLYIADVGLGVIQRVANGVISTVASATGPAGVAVDGSGNVYIADATGSYVTRFTAGVKTTLAGTGTAGYSGDGGAAASAQLNQPAAVTFDLAGNVYIADTANNRVRKINTSGIIFTLAGTGAAGFSGDTGSALSAQLNQPTGLALDASGNLYIADAGNNRVRKLTPGGIITTFAGNGATASAGDGGLATSAAVNAPHGVSLDAAGNVYITDASAKVRKVSTGGIITTIAGTGIAGYSGDGATALNAQFTYPWGIAVDGTGNVYVADSQAAAVRVLQPVATTPVSISSSTSLPQGTVGTPYAQALFASGGTPPYSWSVTFGSLPPGLSLSSTGSITGVPTAAGSSLFTVQVTDSASLTSSATFGIVIAPSTPTGLTITTPATLVSGAVGSAYSQVLYATAGTPPYAWSLAAGTLPTGLGLSSSGMIVGTPVAAGTFNFSLRVTDSVSATTTQNFTLTVISVGTLTRTGVFGHIAVGGTWDTKVYLTNITAVPVALNLIFHADDGTALNLPLTVTQQGSTQSMTTPLLSAVINPNTTLVIDSGSQVTSTVTGWIDVLTSGPLTGFAIFQTASNGTGSAGTSPLQTQLESRMDLPFDNTGFYESDVAIANLGTTAATITATILDTNGVQLGTQSLTIPANGHSSFRIPIQFAVTAGRTGLIQFQNPVGNIAGVGLRANTQAGSFTSIPVILP
jgi:sugar lactone lactonase YvrE